MKASRCAPMAEDRAVVPARPAPVGEGRAGTARSISRAMARPPPPWASWTVVAGALSAAGQLDANARCRPVTAATRWRRGSGSRRRTRLRTTPWWRPSGCSGVQRAPKAGQSGGLRHAVQDQPADALARGRHRSTATGRSAARRRSRHRRRRGRARSPGSSPMPRQRRGTTLEDLAHDRLRRPDCPRARTAAAVLVLDLGAALLELPHAQ